ncbi:MAG: nucleoside-diphosphate sugar epimerase/dehydratase [bacterium]|nr:nucleoside-diphosphate sugar epimerase/dehydratase [bacterium]
MSIKNLKSFLKENLFRPNYFKRAIFFVFFDFILFTFSYFISFSLRFSIGEVFSNFHLYIKFFPIFIFSKILFLLIFDIYSFNWRYFSFNDALKVVFSLTISQIISFYISLIFLKKEILSFLPRSVFFLDYFLSLWFLLTLRSLKRFYISFQGKRDIEKRKKIIIYGAGDAGEQIARDMLSRKSDYNPILFIDDDPKKKGNTIHGLKVVGSIDNIKSVMKENGCYSVLIAIPSIDSENLRRIYQSLEKSGCKEIKILPSMDSIVDGKVSSKDVKNIDITDLIGREKVTYDLDLICEYLKGENVLVTGAAGSIGSEIVNQVVKFNASKIYALDINETELFYLKERMKRKYSKEIEMVLADVRDFDLLEKLIEKEKISFLFHTAALKHVPICENFPYEAVKTNILGTFNLVKAAKGKVKKFLYISTDKAVKPKSVMGATKRIGEIIVISQKDPKTKFFSVRFGNVLGSRGSVIPIFEEQIKNGGPLTVTDKNMTRYFMTIQEAVTLCLEATGIAEGGETFMLDMGKPVKINDVAENIIRMYGYTPHKDIKIVYTGIRKGEKLHEELYSEDDKIEKTRFEKIYKLVFFNDKIEEQNVEKMVEDFKDSDGKVIDILKSYIKDFKYE